MKIFRIFEVIYGKNPPTLDLNDLKSPKSIVLFPPNNLRIVDYLTLLFLQHRLQKITLIKLKLRAINCPHCIKSAFHLAVISALELNIKRDASRADGRKRFNEAKIKN